MPNVLLTSGCNLSCEFCFAQEKMLGKRVDMSMQDVLKVIAFLKRSDCPFFRVMGGEPTLHRRFPEIIQLALQEGMHVDVLSNATWPDEYNDLFARVSPNHLLFLLNIDHPDNYAAGLWAKIEHNLTRLAGRKGITLSFNIFQKQPRYEYIFDLASRYSIDNVRMSFSLPVYGMGNARLEIEEYRDLVPFIMDFVHQAESQGITVQLDNAVPLCIFGWEQAGELLLKRVLDLHRNARCEPIIDIGPDLRTWFCFCLSKLYNRHLDEFATLQEAQAYYRQVVSVYQDSIYPMDECYQCQYRELWGCQGGCLTFAIERDGGRHLDASEGPGHNWQPGMTLGLAEEVEILHYDVPFGSFVLRHRDSQVDVEVNDSFEPLWPLLDGRRRPSQVIEEFISNSAGDGGHTLSDQFVREVMEESLNDLLLGLLQQGFLVQQAA